MNIVKTAGEIIVGELTQTIKTHKDCVIPIFNVHTNNEARLLGSAVLIEIAGSVFMCTAKHVIDKNVSSSLYIAGPEDLQSLEGIFTVANGHDIAVLKLSPEQMVVLGRFTPLPAADIASHKEVQESQYVAFMGYPETKNRKIYKQNVLENFMQLNGCMVKEINDSKVRITFRQKKNIDADSRQMVSAPDPHGMSGGAMFGVPVDAAVVEGRSRPKLVGISTHNPNPEEVFGTNVAIPLAVIRDAFDTTLPSALNPTHIGPMAII